MASIPPFQLTLMNNLAVVSQEPLRSAITSVYEGESGQLALRSAERFFRRLTDQQWPNSVIVRFLAGWGDMHQSALFVSGLIVRLLRAAASSPEPTRTFLNQAAAEMAEIIPEDTGVDGVPHDELFRQFATGLAGSDDWKLAKYSVPACHQFRRFVRDCRLTAPIDTAILITAASENWNSVEYTAGEGLIREWMINSLGRSDDDVNAIIPYVAVHAGNTEAGHFLHAIRAWEFHCHATGRSVEPSHAAQQFERYLTALAQAFLGFEEIFET